MKRENVMEALRKYFSIGNSYTYELTRVKSAFEVGTISLDDFMVCATRYYRMVFDSGTL